MKFAHILSLLGLNAIPAAGWFLDDWSAGTTLAVYWFENIAAAIFIAFRILIHRRLVPLRGHFRYEPTKENKRSTESGPYLRHFLPTTLAFSAVHGIFLAALVFLMTMNGRGAEVRLDWNQIGFGCAGTLLFLSGDFLLDLFTLKKRPFRWIEVLTERNIGRVLMIHMTIMIGVAVGGMTGGARGFFAVFVVLKTLVDLSILLPQYQPDVPPRWLCALMDRVPNVQKKKGLDDNFADFWRRGNVEEKARQQKNERPF